MCSHITSFTDYRTHFTFAHARVCYKEMLSHVKSISVLVLFVCTFVLSSRYEVLAGMQC